ncbi:conserved domain protein [Paenibacillus sp. HGF5]|nr:conserved domain protein [Paenibacillus sp. HGF5]
MHQPLLQNVTCSFHVYILLPVCTKTFSTKKKRSYCLLCSGWQNPFLKGGGG